MATAPGDDGLQGQGAGTRTARSKFLEAVKSAAEASHLELLVDPDGPNSGYGHIQKKDGFANFYSFHFEFGGTGAVFYLGTDSVKSASPELRRQVEYKQGKEMEVVLQEIRDKIGSAAQEAHPHLKSLSEKKPPSVNEAALAKLQRVSPQAENDAAVWGQDAETIKRTRYRNIKPPRRSHASTIAVVILFVVLTLMLVPILSSHSTITACKPASCKTSPAYYQSVSFRFLGFGGLYISQNGSLGVFSTGTIQAANGTIRSGLGMSYFYIVW